MLVPVGEPAADAALGGLDGAVDATLDMRIAERAVSAVLRSAADEVPGVTAVSCRLARSDLFTGVGVGMTVTDVGITVVEVHHASV